MSLPEVDQTNAHLLASKYLKRKSTERSNKDEALVKTEILVSTFGRTKTQSKYFGKCRKEDRKTAQKAGSKRILNSSENRNRSNS